MSALPPISVLYQIGTGHYYSQALFVAAELGVADLLKNGPRTADDLAKECGAHAPSLKRVLRLLVTAGVFVENDDSRFALTPIGEAMQKGPGHSLVHLFAGQFVHNAWGELLHCVRTGEKAFQHQLGMDPFQYFEQHPAEGAHFDQAMSAATAMTAAAVAAAYDFSAFQTLVDVGGSQGVLIGGILKANPGLRGILFELPRVTEGARQWLAAAGLLDRCEVVDGDFFQSVPAGGDAYMLKHVIHDWDDAHATDILKTVRRAMKPDTKLLIVEGVYPLHADQSPASRSAAANDVNMMVCAGGRQRSETEFRALYAAAGFTLSRLIPTQSMSLVIEGVPV